MLPGMYTVYYRIDYTWYEIGDFATCQGAYDMASQAFSHGNDTRVYRPDGTLFCAMTDTAKNPG